MNYSINLAIQVLPHSSKHDTYSLVDKAIEVIQKSGVKYQVCPFETVMEGDFDTLMNIVKEVHEVLYTNGTESMLTNVKIQTANHNVTIKDKMEKYESGSYDSIK